MFKVFIHQIVIQASVSQSIRAMWAFSYVSWGIMWVTKEQQKCTHKLKSRLNGIKDELMRRQLKKRSPAVCAGLNIAGHIRGPHGVKHKGPILCSQHKQNGHRSSSVPLTYRFPHFTDSPALRIIIWPRALIGSRARADLSITMYESHLLMNM